MEVEEIEGLLNQVVGAVDGVSGDVKAVGVKVDGGRTGDCWSERRTCWNQRKEEKTNLTVEAVEQTLMAHHQEVNPD